MLVKVKRIVVMTPIFSTKLGKTLCAVALLISSSVLFVLVFLTTPTLSNGSRPLYPFTPDSSPAPIRERESLFLEELTWIEVRDAVKNGHTRIIIPTGGIEQNGPFVALNKHDKIVKRVTELAAQKLKGTLIAPVVSFVPEGRISPPEGHMNFPGTLSLSPDTFRNVLLDIIRSLNQHGFTEIILIGDSGDSQHILRQVAQEAAPYLSKPGRVFYIESFYSGYREVHAFLQSHGIHETPEPFHDSLPFSLQLLAIDPASLRMEERKAARVTSLGGYNLDSPEARKLGETILDMRAESLAQAIQKIQQG